MGGVVNHKDGRRDGRPVALKKRKGRREARPSDAGTARRKHP